MTKDSTLLELLDNKDCSLFGPLEAPNNQPGPIIGANYHHMQHIDICYAVNLQQLITLLREHTYPKLRAAILTSRTSSKQRDKIKFAGLPIYSIDRYSNGYNATTGIAAARHLLSMPIRSLHVRGMNLYNASEMYGSHPMRPQAADWLDLQQDPRLHLCDELVAACRKLAK